MTRFSRHALALLPALIFLGLWQLTSLLVPSSRFIFSSPTRVADVLWQLLSNGQLFYHLSITAAEALSGFLIGTLAGSLLGLLLSLYPRLASILRPSVLGLASLPIFALAPVMIVWFGIGFFSKVMMATLSTIFVAFIQASRAADEIDLRHRRLFQVMRANRRDVFRKLVLPSTLVWMVHSMKLNIGFALTGAFIGEFVSSQAGLGYVIVRAAGLFDMATVFAGCIALMALALGLGWGVSQLERYLLRWKYVH